MPQILAAFGIQHCTCRDGRPPAFVRPISARQALAELFIKFLKDSQGQSPWSKSGELPLFGPIGQDLGRHTCFFCKDQSVEACGMNFLGSLDESAGDLAGRCGEVAMGRVGRQIWEHRLCPHPSGGGDLGRHHAHPYASESAGKCGANLLILP